MTGVKRLVLTHVFVMLSKRELGLGQTGFHLLSLILLISWNLMLIEIRLVCRLQCVIIIAQAKVCLPKLCGLTLDWILHRSIANLSLLFTLPCWRIGG